MEPACRVAPLNPWPLFRQQPTNRRNLIFFGPTLLKQSTSCIVKKPVAPLIWTALMLQNLSLIIDRDKASLNRRSSRFGTVRDFQLLDDAVHMIFYCILTDPKGMADLLIGRSL